jgi:enterochelin esterase-like enzyme
LRTYYTPLFVVALVITVAILLCAVRAWAQIGTATVTFDVTLPANTPLEDKIYIAGNFQGWDPGATPLTRHSATHASGSITTTEGAALEFKFTRGDWGRGEKAQDCSELPNRKATATHGSTISVTVANWADRCIPVYDTRAEKVRLESNSLGVPKEFYVYTPPGYAASPTRRYPVLFLFRGHQTEWINKNQDGTRGGKNVIDLYEELLAAGTVGPMILVFPGISSEDNSIPGLLTNFKSPQLTTKAGVGTGKFEDYFIKDVMGHVDTHYRTVAAKAARGVDGFSLGGFMSVKIASQHPELFKTAGAFDGTHFYADVDCTDVDAVRDANTFTANDMFDPAFGEPRDTAYAALNNGPNLVCNSTPTAMRSLRWFIQYGPLSGEPLSSNYLRGDHLVGKLTEKGVTNEVPAVLEGGHNWKTADAHMRTTLPLHWQALGPATVIGTPELTIGEATREPDGAIQVQGTGLPLEMHSVEAASTPGGEFEPIGTARADAAGKLTFRDADAGNHAQRFYRFSYSSTATSGTVSSQSH